jgi:chromosome segregation ATPase
MSNKSKQESPLIKSVLALDNYLSELERIGTKINATDMTAGFDVEHIQKLMTRFAECGQGVADETARLSAQLREAQSRAEAVAEGVSRQAELLKRRQQEQNEKLEEFRVLGEKIRELNSAISQFRPPQGKALTHDDRANLTSNLPTFEEQLSDLIEQLQTLKKSAKETRMKALEKNAESLAQTLQTVRQRLRDLSARS